MPNRMHECGGSGFVTEGLLGSWIAVDDGIKSVVSYALWVCVERGFDYMDEMEVKFEEQESEIVGDDVGKGGNKDFGVPR